MALCVNNGRLGNGGVREAVALGGTAYAVSLALNRSTPLTDYILTSVMNIIVADGGWVTITTIRPTTASCNHSGRRTHRTGERG